MRKICSFSSSVSMFSQSEPMMIRILKVLFFVSSAFPASNFIGNGSFPFIIELKTHCKFERNVKLTLASIKNCCEVEFQCLLYDEEGMLIVPEPDDTTTIGKDYSSYLFLPIFSQNFQLT